MSETSRIMVFLGPGQPLEMRECPLPQLKRGEVLVKIDCCTLCGSDLHSHQGRRSVALPTVLGHETLGRIVAIGNGDPIRDFHGRPIKIGDRITWSTAASCGVCFFCCRGLPQKCERLFKYGHERLSDKHPLSGGLADYCHLIAGTAIFPVPDELCDDVASPVNCATATISAALGAVGDCRRQVVLVQGAGALGLTACAMAHHRDAREVIVCDIDPQRLMLAPRFGATRVVNLAPGPDELDEVVRTTTEDRGVDIALEMSGAPDAFQQALRLLRIGGRYAVMGAVFPSNPAQVSVETVVRKLLQIHGVHNYDPEDLEAGMKFLTEAHADYPFAELVADRFSLAEADAAFERAHQSETWRIAVVP